MASSIIRVLLLGLGMLVLASCSKPERPEPPPASPQGAQVAEFFELVKSDRDHRWLDESSGEWLSALPVETRVLIAERALVDADPLVRLVAPQQFYDLGMDGRGDAAIAQLVLDDVDVTAFSWGWLHDRDPKLLERRVAGIRQVVLDRKDQLTPEQRARAAKLLCRKGQPCDFD